MHNTIFDTPVIRTLMCWISLFVFKMRGWRIEGQFPAIAKYVLIAAPHTSNWDFPITLCLTFALKLGFRSLIFENFIFCNLSQVANACQFQFGIRLN